MKNVLSLLIAIVLFASCGMDRHVPNHGAMNKTGSKAFKESQSRVASQFGGANYKKPNKFKRRHFGNWWWTSDIMELPGDTLANVEDPLQEFPN